MASNRFRMHVLWLKLLNFLVSHPFSQPDYIHNLISVLIFVQSTCKIRSSSVVTLARPSVSSSLQTTNRSFKYAAVSAMCSRRLPVESVPFLVLSTSSCSFFSRFTHHTSPRHRGSCTGYLFGKGSSISWRVSLFVHCRAWSRITLLAIVTWLHFPDRDPCGPRSDASAMYHVRTALSVTNPSLPPARAHGTSCRSAYATLGYRGLLSTNI